MSNKPIIHWTDEQIEQISNNYARYIMQMFQDEIVQAKLYDFIAFNPEFNASTIAIEIKYFPYDLTEEELKQYPNNPKVLNFNLLTVLLRRLKISPLNLQNKNLSISLII